MKVIILGAHVNIIYKQTLLGTLPEVKEARKPGLQHNIFASMQKPLTFMLASNKGTDQRAHPRRLISAFDICFLKEISKCFGGLQLIKY